MRVSSLCFNKWVKIWFFLLFSSNVRKKSKITNQTVSRYECNRLCLFDLNHTHTKCFRCMYIVGHWQQWLNNTTVAESLITVAILIWWPHLSRSLHIPGSRLHTIWHSRVRNNVVTSGSVLYFDRLLRVPKKWSSINTGHLSCKIRTSREVETKYSGEFKLSPRITLS